MNAPKVELKKRTRDFAGCIVRLYTALPLGRSEVAVLARQMLRSGTSVAANDREASRARSPGELIAKIELCAQEADETQLWLELLRDDCRLTINELSTLWAEADELIAIFVTMSKNAKKN